MGADIRLIGIIYSEELGLEDLIEKLEEEKEEFLVEACDDSDKERQIDEFLDMCQVGIQILLSNGVTLEEIAEYQDEHRAKLCRYAEERGWDFVE